MQIPVNIGSRRELFVDTMLIDELLNTRLQLQHPERREVVLETNAIAECQTSAYYNFIFDDGKIRLYYRGNSPYHDSPEQTVNYAESSDGVNFTRPVMDIIDFQGNTENSIVYQGVAGHNFYVFRDDNPACKTDERYKAVGGGEWQKLYGLVSPDGLHWRKIQDAPLNIIGEFDSLNVVFWDAITCSYRLFSRKWIGVRSIQSCSSTDFIHWSDPVLHEYGNDTDLVEYYTNATIPCPGAEHILLSFPKRFITSHTKDIDSEEYKYRGEGTSDAVFMSSRDGVNWYRFHEAWVRPGLDQRNWTHRNNMVACGIARTSDSEWSMYISEHYGWETNRLRRLAVQPWRFAGISADYNGGELITNPLIFTGDNLYINASTSAAGSIFVEIQDEEGKSLSGYTLEDAQPWFGDELNAVVEWKNDADVSHLAGQPIRLRFVMKDADIFSLQFK
ncbi:MAG: hypothetical protein WCO98_01195 [bacterium]